jgi:CO/xanthine dehydrogenase Mo-binding subunit
MTFRAGASVYVMVSVPTRDAAARPVCGADRLVPRRGTYAAGTLSCGERSATMADVRRTACCADETYAPPEAFPFGAYGAVVEVDPEPGEVTVLGLVAVDFVMVRPIVSPGRRNRGRCFDIAGESRPARAARRRRQP